MYWEAKDGGPDRWTGCSTPGPLSAGSSGRLGCPGFAASATPVCPNGREKGKVKILYEYGGMWDK